jgi:hypothetical protein
VTYLEGLQLNKLKWERTSQYNIGGNFGFFNDRITGDFNYYFKRTKDLLMSGVRIPSSTGFSSLSWSNVGEMTNKGWELNIQAKDFIKIGKFKVSANFNIAQNFNEIVDMDESVLESINSEWAAGTRGQYLNRIQKGNPLGSIYGLRYKGVYQYTYDYLENYQKENNLTTAQYESWINDFLASGKTAPVAIGADGKVIMNNNGTPQRMMYAYGTSSEYSFQGGDAMYEDINNDGQINALDIVYLGNSLPKVNGGFNIGLNYGRWSLKARFNYRFGNKVVNLARMNLENMYGTNNQSATVNYRWRKDGDVTPMPRAMYAAGYNWQNSDRYVEDGGFVRFQNLQIAYNFDKKLIKKWGLNQLQAYASLNNLYVWTRYSGVDPEVSASGYNPALDKSQTPRSKQFTFTLNIGF